MKLLSSLYGIVALMAVLVFTACTAPQQVAQVKIDRNPLKFDYAPKHLTQVGSAETTIALVNPTYGNAYLRGTVFNTYSKSMGNDFEELLTAKGFKIRGPFEQIGEMLYNDKQNSDFIIQIEIDLDFVNLLRTVKTIANTPTLGELLINSNAQTTYYYKYEGTGSFTTTLVLTALSTNFHEKLWKKNITLKDAPISYQGKKVWKSGNANFLEEINQDNYVYNIFTSALMEQYDDIFELLEKQIEVEEFNQVKEEAHKVDQKN